MMQSLWLLLLVPFVAGMKIRTHIGDTLEEDSDIRGKQIIYGIHHKAGSVLLRGIGYHAHEATGMSCAGCAEPCSKAPGARMQVVCGFSGPKLRKHSQAQGKQGLKVVHIVRDPAEMVVSDFIYHLHSEDTNPLGSRKLRQMSSLQGLAWESEFLLRRVFPQMVSAHKEAMALPDTNLLTVKFEDFTSSSQSFDASVAQIYNFTIASKGSQRKAAELAKREDIRRHPLKGGMKGHDAPKSFKLKLKETYKQLPADIRARVEKVRFILGYSDKATMDAVEQEASSETKTTNKIELVASDHVEAAEAKFRELGWSDQPWLQHEADSEETE